MTRTAAVRLGRGKKVLFASICVAVLLLVAEAVHRVIAFRRYAKVEARFESLEFYDEDRNFGYVMKPGTWSNVSPGWQAALGSGGAGPGATQDGAQEFNFTVNSLRLRGPEIARGRATDSIRVICLGGSTTFGTGCRRDSQTYPAQLEARLRERFPERRVEVLNAGVPGYRTTESILNLRRLGHLGPKVVVIYHSINDIVQGNDGPFYSDPEKHPRPPTRLERCRLAAHSFFLEECFRRVAGSGPGKFKRGTGLVSYPAIWQGFERNLRRLVELSRELDALPVVLTFPTRLRKNLGAEQRLELLEGPIFRSYFPTYGEMEAALDRYNNVIREVARSERATLIDLEDAVPSDAVFWVDFCHLNDAGTRRMVEAIEPPVARLIEDAGARD